MTPEQRARVKEDFFHIARYVSAADWSRVLHERCGDDPVVHEAVRLQLVEEERVRADPPVVRHTQSIGSTVSGPAPPPVEVNVGEVVLDRYELRELIGEGGQGRVFAAHDRIDRTDVAVKFLAPRRGVSADGLIREVIALRRARVPGIVEFLTSGEHRGAVVLIMALASGKPFPGDGVDVGDAGVILPRAAALIETVARLHAIGVFHRDLKPSNVLVDAAGRITLVDLGLAQDETDPALLRGRGEAGGTPYFLPPESRLTSRATVQSELYSIGVMLVDALTGLHPHALAERGVETALRDCVPAPIAALVASMVAREPRDRPPSLRAVLDALEREIGPRRNIELPWLGSDEPIRTLLDAARTGRALDVVGPSGSGRTRLLAEVERRLTHEGYLVRRVLPAPNDGGTLERVQRESLDAESSWDAHDRAVCAAIRRHVADGLVVLADDAEGTHESPRAPPRASLAGAATVDSRGRIR